MQIYEGLDIATNKPTEEEKSQIPHHLFGYVSPLSFDYNVGKYVEKALKIIEEIHTKNKVPILVGGTHYYLLTLLWTGTLKSDLNNDASQEPKFMDENEKKSMMHHLDDKIDLNSDLWDQLNKVDPVMARKLHRNNDRKIIRSLKIYYETGIPHSELILNQKEELRWETCFLWVDCKLEILDKRLDDRVDVMIQRGLLDELISICRLIKSNGFPLDFTKGILQAIGGKEFSEFITLYFKYELEWIEEYENESKELMSPSLLLQSSNLKDSDWEKAFQLAINNGIDSLKLHTRQYARKQRPWVLNKLLPRHGVFCIPAHGMKLFRFFYPFANNYVLNVFQPNILDISQWNETILSPTLIICEEFLDKNEEKFKLTNEWFLKQTGKEGDLSKLLNWEKYECEVCNRTVNGEIEWKAHLSSKNHRRNKRIQNKNKKQQQL